MSQIIYRVKKVLNNNVVLATHGFNEVIVVGLGIGFDARPMKAVPHHKIEKVFELQREDLVKTTQLAMEIPEADFLNLYRLISATVEETGLALDPHAYITIVDHIYFALQRIKSGQDIRNMMLFDLKILYDDAYQFSANLLRRINETFHVTLPEDEIGFLTMHVVNGSNSDINNQTSRMTDAIFDCLNVVRDYYLIPLKLDQLQTQRIMIHIKMLLIRVLGSNQVDDSEKVLYNVFDEFESAYTCAKQIQKLVEHRFDVKINTQELVYLTIHLNRLEHSR
ncbi:hypothetical protein AOC36_10455 [Erysipelothrix larvae]|uniref:PRD domain-containing protein n=1 Tax=Erysipelothrix larvae TaxID=1514105 RepID=A0A0X8H1H6_9FIRM|nr:PRD domain-containing protein [Erysipelothrix larvae]AMC94377.1 hypothetical protein AOC36_10455 [Erysipelothrix larvae]